MHDEDYARNRFGKAVGYGPLVLPFVAGETRRIIYTIIEYDPLLDSSNMSIKEWVQIAEDIKVGQPKLHYLKKKVTFYIFFFSFPGIVSIL